MIKQKNILGELKRKPNNKKITSRKRALELACDYMAKRGKIVDDMIDDAMMHSFQYKKPPQEEMSLAKAIIIVATAILVFALFPLLQRAMDIKALQNCKTQGDCSEVIRDINAD